MRAFDSVWSDSQLKEDILTRLCSLRTESVSERSLSEARDYLETYQLGGNVPLGHNALESIILLLGRPALRIIHDTYEVPESDVWHERLLASREKIERAIPAVGRLDTSNVPGFDWIGTAWVVHENIIVTNRHVAIEFARQKSDDRFEFRRNFKNELMKARLDTREEVDQSTEIEFAVEEVVYISEPDDFDIALLRVKTVSDEGVPLPPAISLSSRELIPDTDVAVIGYPARDSRASSGEMEKIFGNIYDVKRLSPGKASPTQWEGIVSHDCTTLGGSSGSVILDMQTGEAVGIHFRGGNSTTGNAAISATKIRAVLDSL